MKLGEAFIQQGLISDEQLEEALHLQLVSGGHLGTCLLELGYVNEFQLGRALSSICNVPFAPFDKFRRIPPEVIEKIPARLAERHGAVPFELHDKILRVAMIHPNQLSAHDDISFASGCDIEPWVAPEARILQLLERYHQIPRSQRFVILCRRLDGDWINAKPRGTERSARSENPVRTQSTVLQGPWQTVSERGEPVSGRPDSPKSSKRSPLPSRKDLPATPPINWADMDGELPPDPEVEISDRLCRADSAEGLAEAILNYASRRLARCILFSVRSDRAVIWAYRGFEMDLKRTKDLELPIESEPIFHLFLGDGVYRGPLPRDPRCHRLYDTLGIKRPSRIIVLPVYLDDRLVAIFYGDGRRESDLKGDTEQYKMMLRKLSLALDLVSLKRKIRSL